MFDETKIQALIDELREMTGMEYIHVADEVLVDILKRLLAEMQQHRHYAWALMETLIQRLGDE